MLVTRPLSIAVLLLLLGGGAASAQVRPGGWDWGRAGWDGPGWDRASSTQRLNSQRDEREGKVDADSFLADGAAALLGHGAIVVAPRTDLPPDARGASDLPIYEAALIDQLVKAGYETAAPDPAGGQRAEIRILRDELVPEEQKRKPVSGSMTVGAGTYGSMVGMGLALDLSKPRKALISTRLEVRILDAASDQPLWEGHAQIATRAGDSRWTEQAIAGRLASALFARFPAPSIRTAADR